tara:strand:+ start:2785 stop:3549 length:765 start_codon:yes stop_codon:yes gene_type:complete
MLNKAQTFLTELGLKENEAKVYIACLQKPLGMLVHEVVSMTDLKRSTVDLILLRLRKQRYITRYKQGARWVYCAEDPSKIAHSVEDKITEFKDFIPSLLGVIGHGGVPNIKFYEGRDAVESIYNDILLTSKRLMGQDYEIAVISSGSDLISLLPNHYPQFVKKRIKAGIPTRILAPSNEISKTLYRCSEPQLRKSRFFNNGEFSFRIEINIFADKVAFINFTEPSVIGIIIENATIADSMKAIFNMLWKGNPET